MTFTLFYYSHKRSWSSFRKSIFIEYWKIPKAWQYTKHNYIKHIRTKVSHKVSLLIHIYMKFIEKLNIMIISIFINLVNRWVRNQFYQHVHILLYNFFFISFTLYPTHSRVGRGSSAYPSLPSVKTLRSTYSAEFWRHCVLSSRNQHRACPWHQSEEMEI